MGPGGQPVLLLTSVDDPDVGFVVVPPWVFYPDYEFDLDSERPSAWAWSQSEDAVVFAVVTLRDVPRRRR